MVDSPPEVRSTAPFQLSTSRPRCSRYHAARAAGSRARRKTPPMPVTRFISMSSYHALSVQLFHYHLVTSRVREVEGRYVGKLGFDLVARHGRIGEELTSYEPGVSWEELDAKGFKLRLTELEKGAVNVVVQPGQWPVPRVDHVGLVLDQEEFEATLERAERLNLRIQEHA